MNDPRKRRRKWQFSIRAVLAWTALVAVMAAILAVWSRRPEQRQLIVGVTAQGTVTLDGKEMPLDQALPLLSARRRSIDRPADGSSAAATVIIRAHCDVSTRQVVELINACQSAGFEEFALRADE